MELGELISVYRRQAGLTIDELAAKSGVPKGTINKIIGGITKAPTLDNVKAIARALGLRLADFDDEPQLAEFFTASEQEIIENYRNLDEHGREMVDLVIDGELKRIAQKSQSAHTLNSDEDSAIRFPMPYYRQASSVGFGDWADSECAEKIMLVKEPPFGAAFIIPVNGDSMEPTYPDGCKVFVRPQHEIRDGQVGIFFMDGKLWLKELGNKELISHNDRYPPQPFREDLRCWGLVVGICDDSYLGI